MSETTNVEVDRQVSTISPERPTNSNELIYQELINLKTLIESLKVEIASLKEYEANKPMSYPTASEETDKLSEAISMAKLMGYPKIKKTGKREEKPYSTLEDLISAFLVPLSESNLEISFCMEIRHGLWVLVSKANHVPSKQWKETYAELDETAASTRMNESQALSSSLTYKKRDAYRLLLGI